MEIKYAQKKDNLITIVSDDGMVLFTPTDPKFALLAGAIDKQDMDKIVAILQAKAPTFTLQDGFEKVVEKYGNGFTYKDDVLYYHDEPVDESITNYLTHSPQRLEHPERVLMFVERLSKNPSYTTRQRIFSFLLECGLNDDGFELSAKGKLIAYKGVNTDLTSIHSGFGIVNGKEYHNAHIPNHVGHIIEIPRSMIDDNPNVGCSVGLHVGTLSYAKTFIAKGVILKCLVDPADIVSVPFDCSNQKIRTSRYQVLDTFEYEVKEESWSDIDDPLDSQLAELSETLQDLGYNSETNTRYELALDCGYHVYVSPNFTDDDTFESEACFTLTDETGYIVLDSVSGEEIIDYIEDLNAQKIADYINEECQSDIKSPLNSQLNKLSETLQDLGYNNEINTRYSLTLDCGYHIYVAPSFDNEEPESEGCFTLTNEDDYVVLSGVDTAELIDYIEDLNDPYDQDYYIAH